MNPHPELVDGVDVDAVAGAVRTCPGVAGLAGGSGAVVSYLPGRKLEGVRVEPDRVVVQVLIQWGYAVPQIARELRSRVGPLVPSRRVDVVAADLVDVPGWEDTGDRRAVNQTAPHP